MVVEIATAPWAYGLMVQREGDGDAGNRAREMAALAPSQMTCPVMELPSPKPAMMPLSHLGPPSGARAKIYVGATVERAFEIDAAMDDDAPDSVRPCAINLACEEWTAPIGTNKRANLFRHRQRQRPDFSRPDQRKVVHVSSSPPPTATLIRCHASARTGTVELTISRPSRPSRPSTRTAGGGMMCGRSTLSRLRIAGC